MDEAARDRFWRKVERFGADGEEHPGCWEWTGAQNGHGYGHLSNKAAHRAAYEFDVGPIPTGLDLDHLCLNRLCVRPEHLEAVSRRTNLLRAETVTAKNARKKACPKGHPYVGENLYRTRWGRQCRTCIRARGKSRETDAI